ncbi:MAG: putative inner membrane protein [Syntrophaceae bacterium PtaU1.Bin231]|nr:MAG: putative inner membrane protein [Syntrophaceae bacterium PtaU1.Bin231]
MVTTTSPRELTRTTLSLLFIGVLIAANVWILKPFLTSFVWAVIIVAATWPVLIRIQTALGGRRGAAVTVMTLALLAIFIAPLIGAVLTVMAIPERVDAMMQSLAAQGLPPIPEWVTGIPFIGAKLAEAWGELASAGREDVAARLAPYAGAIFNWLAERVGGRLMMIVEFLLTVIIAAILYSAGESATDAVLRFARRLAGQRGEDVVVLAGKTIRGVALGVGLTAVVQTALGAIGLAVAGVPGAIVLTAVMFVLCIAQLGPALVLFPAVGWLFWSGQTLWGTLLLIWSIVVVTLDNVLRPVLIKKGADLPLLLIFAGVIGGLLGFGIIGLFIGPVVLAVTYTLLGYWVGDAEVQTDRDDPAAPAGKS